MSVERETAYSKNDRKEMFRCKLDRDENEILLTIKLDNLNSQRQEEGWTVEKEMLQQVIDMLERIERKLKPPEDVEELAEKINTRVKQFVQEPLS